MTGPKNLKLAIAVAALASAVCISSAAQASNLLINGSFEDTTNFTDNSGNDTTILSADPANSYFPSSALPMTGWTVIGATGSELAWIGPTNPYTGFADSHASDGSYFLDLTGYNGFTSPFGGVSQTIATTAGSSYQLTFDLGDDQNYNGGYTFDAITASAGSTSQTFDSSTDPSTDDWTTETLNFTATGATTTISLIGAQGDNFIGLDNINVSLTSAVPEPATWAMFLIGFGAIGFAMRGSRKQTGAVAA